MNIVAQTEYVDSVITSLEKEDGIKLTKVMKEFLVRELGEAWKNGFNHCKKQKL